MGGRGPLEAARSAVVSDTGPQLRGAWLDVMNRNFVRRLHHHAMTGLVDLVRTHCASRPDPSRAPGP